MPYNILFKTDSDVVNLMWFYAHKIVERNCQEIKERKRENLKINFFKKIHTPLFRIEWWYAKVQGPVMKVNRKKCLTCGKCIEDCPNHNIEMKKGKIVFHNRCSLCMRCTFFCPTSAISIGLLNRWKVQGPYNFAMMNYEDLPVLRDNRRNRRLYKPYFDRWSKELNLINLSK